MAYLRVYRTSAVTTAYRLMIVAVFVLLFHPELLRRRE